jgi:hypothetical protein
MISMYRKIEMSGAAAHRVERDLTYLPIWRREAGLVRPGFGLVAVVGRPGAVVLRRWMEGVSSKLEPNPELHRTPHDGQRNLIAGGEETAYLGLQDVVEGRGHADGEAAAVVLGPGPRVLESAKQRRARFRGRRWRRRLRRRGGRLGGGPRCGGGGGGNGGVDGEATARGAAAAEEAARRAQVKWRWGVWDGVGGGHGAAPSGGRRLCLEPRPGK